MVTVLLNVTFKQVQEIRKDVVYMLDNNMLDFKFPN